MRFVFARINYLTHKRLVNKTSGIKIGFNIQVLVIACNTEVSRHLIKKIPMMPAVSLKKSVFVFTVITYT